MTENEQKKPRGFAAMDPERQKEIASAGGKAAHERGSAHHWNEKSAAEAGRKGGRVAAEKRRARRASEPG